ncbi:uncharacterized protein LOC103836687 isoform X2 [Brassica rapa]|uniref:uncharacterized protein LOC103836687 isoform X2 n=1 Tax=Brassica campestris TaxID=3711 RepID=UPI00142DD558|nr:uncharacterized protein LOC103836687 isoform X2 [Brassica rapa]
MPPESTQLNLDMQWQNCTKVIMRLKALTGRNVFGMLKPHQRSSTSFGKPIAEHYRLDPCWRVEASLSHLSVKDVELEKRNYMFSSNALSPRKFGILYHACINRLEPFNWKLWPWLVSPGC